MCFRRVSASCGLAIVWLSAVGAVARASAFLAPVGEGEVITATEFSGSTRAFDANGKLIPIPEYAKFELASYIEYGVLDDVTLIAQPFFDAAHQDDTSVSTPGVEIGARLGLAQFGPSVISVQGLVNVPFSPARLGEADFDEDDVVSGDLRLLIGHTFLVEGAPGFLDLQGGYRWQTDGLPNEWHADFTAGIHPLPRFLLMLQTFATFADRSTAVCDRYYWFKLQESGVYDLSRDWSLQGGFFETIVGMNAGRELGPMVGLWYRF